MTQSDDFEIKILTDEEPPVVAEPAPVKEQLKAKGQEIAGKMTKAATKTAAKGAVAGTKLMVKGTGKAVQKAIASEVVQQLKDEARSLPGRAASGEFELQAKAKTGTVRGLRWLSQRLRAWAERLQQREGRSRN